MSEFLQELAPLAIGFVAALVAAITYILRQQRQLSQDLRCEIDRVQKQRDNDIADAQDEARRLREENVTAKEHWLSRLEAVSREKGEEIARLRERVDLMVSERAVLNEELQDARLRIELLSQQLNTLQEKYEDLLTSYGEVKAERDLLRERYERLDRDFADLQELFREFQASRQLENAA